MYDYRLAYRFIDGSVKGFAASSMHSDVDAQNMALRKVRLEIESRQSGNFRFPLDFPMEKKRKEQIQAEPPFDRKRLIMNEEQCEPHEFRLIQADWADSMHSFF